jgi:hypothetical protein
MRALLGAPSGVVVEDAGTVVTGDPGYGIASFILIAPDGDKIDVHTDPDRFGYRALKGWTGMDLPPTTLYMDSAPLLDGGIPRGARYEPRNIIGGVHVVGADRADFRARKRRLLRALLTNRMGKPSPGTFIYVEPDGTTRQGQYLYAGGAEGSRAADQYGIVRQKIMFTLRFPDPWAYDPNVYPLVFTPSPGGAFFPILPIKLVSSRLGTVTLENPGDAPASPLWVITGPATAVTLTNQGTGETLVLTKNLLITDTVTIDTRRGIGTVRDQSGTNFWPYLSTASTLWQVQPGAQVCTIDVAGSGAGTSVTVSVPIPYATFA